MNAFMTGSHVYGKPGPQSDIDLAILTDDFTRRMLIHLSDNKQEPIRFGRLNLLVFVSADEYAAWKLATRAMQNQSVFGDPVTREYAIDLIDQFLTMSGQSRYQGTRSDDGTPEQTTDPITPVPVPVAAGPLA